MFVRTSLVVGHSVEDLVERLYVPLSKVEFNLCEGVNPAFFLKRFLDESFDFPFYFSSIELYESYGY